MRSPTLIGLATGVLTAALVRWEVPPVPLAVACYTIGFAAALLMVAVSCGPDEPPKE